MSVSTDDQDVNTLTFEVDPVAMVTQAGQPGQTMVPLDNSDLASGANFTFRLDVTKFFAEGQKIKAVHKDDDGKVIEEETVTVQRDGATLYVEVTAKRFSLWDLTPVIEPEEPVFVDEVTVDGGRYVLDHDHLTATFAAAEDSKATSVTVADKVKANGQKYKVTAIAKGACKNMSKLKIVAIGKYVSSIGQSAFNGCMKLKTVTGGQGLKTIGDYAFRSCGSLTAITLETKVTTIGKGAFRDCIKLKTITLKTKKLKTVATSAFRNIQPRATIHCPDGKAKKYAKLLRTAGIAETAKVK